MENFSIMSELAKIFLESLRKQSFSLILSVVGLVGLGWWNVDYKAEMGDTIRNLTDRVDNCAREREALAIELAGLREKLNSPAGSFAGRKR